MNKILYDKIMEAFSSVLPVTVIVLVASVVLVPIPSGNILMFIVGAALLIVGMGFFTLGADMAMMPMGEGIGIQLTKTSNLFLIILISFIMGTVITIAEPDLQVLAGQVPAIPSVYLIYTVAGGVGVFLVIAILRVILKLQLPLLLIIFYGITFAVVAFAPPSFIAVAFDSGGVTTGPITVPFILAMGAGVASIRADKGSKDDSFGLVSLCSIGPILTVLILGIFFNPTSAGASSTAVPAAATSRDVILHFASDFPHYAREVLSALAAIIGFFVVFQLISHRYSGHQLKRILMGFVYTFIGLVVFLTGVNVGFIPVGHLIGVQLASSNMKWVLVPFAMLVGYFIVAAEPAVHVLNKQVEDITSGAITQKSMNQSLAIGMASALAITMVKILLGIPILYILIPGYAIAILLTFVSPRIFTGIAFDSGGVCSGPMTSTFLMPFAIGVCEGAGRDMMKDAFGIVAMVAMAPLVVIQITGLVFKIKSGVKVRAAEGYGAERAGEVVEYEDPPLAAETDQ